MVIRLSLPGVKASTRPPAALWSRNHSYRFYMFQRSGQYVYIGKSRKPWRRVRTHLSSSWGPLAGVQDFTDWTVTFLTSAEVFGWLRQEQHQLADFDTDWFVTAAEALLIAYHRPALNGVKDRRSLWGRDWDRNPDLMGDVEARELMQTVAD